MQTVHPAWSVVLEHTPLDPHLACTLLSVSCGMRHTVHLLCAGKLSVELCDAGADSERKLRSFARWLPRHAALLDHLDTEELVCVQSTAAAASMEAITARAMWEAGSKLQVDSCAFYSGMLVQQAALLPSLRTRLTSLIFAPEGGEWTWPYYGHVILVTVSWQSSRQCTFSHWQCHGTRLLPPRVVRCKNTACSR